MNFYGHVELAYAQVLEFFRLLNADEALKLERKFHVSKAVLEEVKEMLEEYFPRGTPKLEVAPIEIAFLKGCGGRAPFDVHAMNESNALGIEVMTFADAVPAEPIFHFEASIEKGVMILRFKYLGS